MVHVTAGDRSVHELAVRDSFVAPAPCAWADAHVVGRAGDTVGARPEDPIARDVALGVEVPLEVDPGSRSGVVAADEAGRREGRDRSMVTVASLVSPAMPRSSSACAFTV